MERPRRSSAASALPLSPPAHSPLTLNGTHFVSGAQVTFGSAPFCPPRICRATKLTATGSEASAGIFAVTVSNPKSGSSASGSINVSVTTPSGGNPPPPLLRLRQPARAAESAWGREAQSERLPSLPGGYNLWNLNIANAAVDPNSAAIINFIGGTDPVHPDFGAGQFDGFDYRNSLHSWSERQRKRR